MARRPLAPRRPLAALLLAAPLLATALASPLLTGCAAGPSPELYQTFGGQPGLTALVDDFMDGMMRDPDLRPYFVNANRAHIKKELVSQFCATLGGPCAYKGMDMKMAHARYGIGDHEFNALVEALQTAMDRQHIPYAAQNRFLAMLAPFRDDIVHPPPPPRARPPLTLDPNAVVVPETVPEKP
ncbi:group 1 truncated hemoglobin [Nitrospirillum sp. BR 11828]|uniref:group I truncated hemoglobin n=1 Tax=Nitrospirillum sp. BR 11828 TaxID=3104325 RepID=UPI002ACAF96D|nr:group 1 truncated hemoglobin [Nitrospirillum sp. BR 11828]MDZ5646310.1 group 1 truncated hemoglobin [Nitrospirillum sp. BR 11828]